jgi:hypothetical protein
MEMDRINNQSSSRDIQEEFRKWSESEFWNRPFSVTLTFKERITIHSGLKTTSVPLTNTDCSKNLRLFLGVLNRKCCGKLGERYGRWIPVIPILEGGNGVRLHYHLLLDCPFENDPHDTYPTLIRTLWSQTPWGYDQVDIQPTYEVSGWMKYITKLRTKPDFSDSIDWMNLERPSSNSPLIRHRWD